MYGGLIVLQYISIFIVLACIIILLPRKHSRQKEVLLIAMLGILFNELCYTQELQSTTLEAAIMATKLGYVGKLIAELMVFFFIMECSGVSIKWPAISVLGIGHVLICGLVWSCEYQKLFYSSIEFTKEGMFPHLVLGHGVFYYLFMMLTFGYMVAMVIFGVRKFKKTKNLNVKKRVICLMVTPVVFAVCLAVYMLGVTDGYDLTIFAYALGSIALLVAIMRYDLVDKKEIAKDIILDEIGEPVFAADNGNCIFYANNRFKNMFPDKDQMGYEQNVIEQSAIDGSEYELDGRYYHVSGEQMVSNGNILGKIYVMHDVTATHDYSEQLEQQVYDKTENIRQMQDRLVLSMATMVESRDPGMGGHIRRTTAIVQMLADEMEKDEKLKLPARFYECLVKAAPMHDLGKIGVEDAILNKPGKYTREEFAQVRQHPAKGAEIVHELLSGTEDTYFAQIAENVAHYHHERFDGTGYPTHLSGDNIPLEGRIMAIADVYDALVSHRRYKESISFDDAFYIIESSMGTQFDPMLNKYFVAARGRIEEFYTASLDQEA